MTTPDSEVGARLNLSNKAQFVADAKEASAAVASVGTSAEESGTKAEASAGRFKTFSDRVGKSGGVMSRAGGQIKGLAAGFAAFFALEKIKDVVQGSIEDANNATKAQRQTAAALKSTHDASGESAAGIDRLSKHMENFTGQNKLANQSMLNLLLTFPGIKKGSGIFQEAAKQASNVAARLGISQSSATRMVGKALQNGTTGLTALGRVGIKFSDAQNARLTRLLTVGDLTAKQAKQMSDLQGIQASSTKKLTSAQASNLAVLEKQSKGSVGASRVKAQSLILEQLQRRVGGAAKANITPMERLKVKWEDLEETLGKKLLPRFNQLMDWLTKKGIPDLEKFGSWVQKNQNILKIIGITLVGLIGAWKIYRAVTLLAAAASAIFSADAVALDAALDANPISMIIIGLALLAVGLIYAYKHCATFRTIVQDAFHVAAIAIDFVKAHWKLFALAIGLYFFPIVTAIVLIVTHFKLIKNAVMNYIVNPVVSAYHAVVNWFGKVVGFVASMPHKIANAAVGMWDGIKDAFKGVINWIIRGWDSLHFTIGGGHHFGVSIPSFTLGVPPIQQWKAGGGYLTRGMAYGVGEAGRELFIPQSNGMLIPNSQLRGGDGASSISPRGLLPQSGSRAVVAAAMAGEGVPVVLQVVLDKKVLAEATYQVTRDKAARL